MDFATILVGTGSRFDASPKTIDEAVHPYEVVDLRTAITTEWPDDRHFTCYQVTAQGRTLPYWPRLNYGSLVDIRSRDADVLQVCLALDYDLPGKREWGIDEPEQMFSYLESFRSSEWQLPVQWTCLYTTLHGLRIVYGLKRSISPERVAPKLSGMIRDFLAGSGLKFDEACKDWTRLFRLPKVVRDGKRTSDQPYFRLWWQDTGLDAETIADGESERRFNANTAGVSSSEPMPTPEEARAYLYAFNTRGQEVETVFFKEAKARLRGREVLDIITYKTTLVPGTRDVGITKAIGQACALLVGIEGITTRHVYALFDEVASQMKPDEGTPDWRFSVWSKVLRIFGKEMTAHNDRLVQQKQIEAVQHDALGQLLLGLRQWCPDPRVKLDDAYATRWASEHAIVCAKRSYYILKPSGYYDSLPVSYQHLPARIREIGMEPFIPTREPTQQGGFKDISPQTIISRHGTLVNTLVGAVDVPEAMLINPGLPEARLIFRLFHRRTDLEPTYSPDVDQWLRSWCYTQDDYDRLVAWIAHALNFEGGPICALSLCGAPGAGKKLLVQGLAECISTETHATGREFETAYGYALLRTPFLFLNEGLPANVRNFSETFRRLVGGDPIEVNAKFQDPIVINNPVRMVVTANNLDSVINLVGHQDLTLEDQQAIVQRLLHVTISPSAPHYLSRRGGLAYTGTPGRRWIRGDSGAASDYIVARHFLWLYERRPAIQPGSRFLVEGSMDSEILRLISLRSGASAVIVEAIVRLIEKPQHREGLVVDFENREVCVSAAMVLEFVHEYLYSRLSKAVSIRTVANALKSLSLSRAQKRATSDNRCRMYNLDLHKLHQEASDYGYPCQRLHELIYGKVASLTRPGYVQ